MSNPAQAARLANPGFTETKTRHRHGITLRNPATGKCCFESQVGQVYHYGTTLEEADSSWVAGVAPWQYQITKCDFNLFALSNFSSGRIIKWLDPVSGQYVEFQPMALQWTNSLNQIQQISMPQSVVAQASDDVLYWPAAYGSGRNFRYQASPLRLSKQLIIDSAASLPSTSYDTLELNFIIGESSGVDIMVNGAKWNKKTQKDTTQSIAFQLPGGAVLWSFAVPRAWDSAGNDTTGSMRVKKSGNSLYVSVRFPKIFFDSATYPVYIDPTVNYQVGAGANDGYWCNTGPTFNNSGTTILLGRDGFGADYNMWSLFTGVTIPNLATIDSAYASFRYYSKSGTIPTCLLYFEDAANPSTISSYSDGNGRTRTTACISGVPPSATGWNNITVTDVIRELVASYNYASGAAMQLIYYGPGSGDPGNILYRSYDYAGVDSGPKLHIEYTEAEVGNPFYAYAQQ